MPDARVPFLQRLALIVGVGAASGWSCWLYRQAHLGEPSDFWVVWAAARAWLDHQNPYALIGPGLQYDFHTAFFYPLPAVLLALPLAPVPPTLLDPLLMAVSGALLAMLLSRDGWSPRLLLLFSTPWLRAVQLVQVWEVLSLVGALYPGVGFLLAAKPSVSIPVWLAHPSRRSLLMVALFGGVSLLLWPAWPLAWRTAVSSAGHFTPLLMKPGGVLILLAALRWRRPEARLLLGLAVIPHTAVLYAAIPLFLVPDSWTEAAIVLACSYLVPLGLQTGIPYASYDAWVSSSATWMVWCLYLPCVAMVLRRPNASPALAA